MRILTELRIAAEVLAEFVEEHPEHYEALDRAVQALVCVAENMLFVRTESDGVDGNG